MRITGKSYIGSSMSLDRRILNYYRPSYLKSTNTIIAKALLKHGHSNFSLEILEYLTLVELMTIL
jgi:group I intron endonuclease